MTVLCHSCIGGDYFHQDFWVSSALLQFTSMIDTSFHRILGWLRYAFKRSGEKCLIFQDISIAKLIQCNYRSSLYEFAGHCTNTSIINSMLLQIWVIHNFLASYLSIFNFVIVVMIKSSVSLSRKMNGIH